MSDKEINVTVTLHDRLGIPEDVVSRKLGEETVLLNLASGIYYGLNPVGTRFLELIAEHHELAVVHSTMLREFKVSSENLKTDLLWIAGQMLAKGLLVKEVLA